MSAHVKRPEVGLPSIITADDEWNRQLETPNLKVIDVYGKIVIYKAKWAGPCEPMQTIFKKSKQEYGEGILFIQAQTDYIEALKNFKDKSCPTFLLFFVFYILFSVIFW
jgi:thiol-disulfide isomerase/thioredoxin